MVNHEASFIEKDKIPLIDISGINDNVKIIEVSKLLHKASKEIGFIYVKNHGIPNDILTNLRSSAKKFFSFNEQNKKTVNVNSKHRGWISQGGAKMQDKVSADLKESFIWGYQDVNGKTIEDHPLRGANQWPKFCPDLEKNAMDFFQHGHKVANMLMRGFAVGLGLDEEFFVKHTGIPLSRGSIIYYPNQDSRIGNNNFGVGPHTDFGVLTLLFQDNIGGLQVQDIHGNWIHAPPIDGTIVVNVGDLLSRWTEGEYKSTPHRVINNSGKERISMVIAYDPEPDTIIDSQNIFGKKSEFQPITCGDYLIWRFNKAFSYRKK